MTTLSTTYRAPNELRHYVVGLCTIAAITVPLYVHFGSLDWVVTGFGWVRGDLGERIAPPNLDAAVGWSLWFVQAGAIVGAGVVAVLAVSYWFATPERRQRRSASIVRCLVGELLWVAASLLAIGVLVNGLIAQ